MAEIEVLDDRIVITLRRADRLWTFRGELDIPIDHITGVEVDPEQARIPLNGLPVRDRANGWAPGVMAAGNVREADGWAFWDVTDPAKAVIVSLADERWHRLVVEVEDPEATAGEIRRALDGAERPEPSGAGS
jgi:hypothetical protein